MSGLFYFLTRLACISRVRVRVRVRDQACMYAYIVMRIQVQTAPPPILPRCQAGFGSIAALPQAALQRSASGRGRRVTARGEALGLEAKPLG